MKKTCCKDSVLLHTISPPNPIKKKIYIIYAKTDLFNGIDSLLRSIMEVVNMPVSHLPPYGIEPSPSATANP